MPSWRARWRGASWRPSPSVCAVPGAWQRHIGVTTAYARNGTSAPYRCARYCVDTDGRLRKAGLWRSEALSVTVTTDSLKIDSTNYTTLSVRDYCGSYIYKNDKLERILTAGGYMQDGKLYFYIKDYQAGTRVELNQLNQPVVQLYWAVTAIFLALVASWMPSVDMRAR